MPETGSTTEASKGQEPGKRFSSAITAVIAESEGFREFREKLDPQSLTRPSAAQCDEFRKHAEEELIRDAADPKKVPLWDQMKDEIKLQPEDDPSKPIYATHRVRVIIQRNSAGLIEKINGNPSLIGLTDLRRIREYYLTIKALSEGTASLVSCADANGEIQKTFDRILQIVKDPLVRVILAKDRTK